jgi:hypothetical protein
MIFGASAFGSPGLPVIVTTARCLDLSSVWLNCDPSSVFGIRNPWRRDSLFCWRNWTLTPLATGKTRLVRSVQIDGANLRVCFDGRLTPEICYQLQCSLAAIEVYFAAPAVHATAIELRSREQIVQDWAKPERAQDLQGGSLGSTQIVAGDLALTSGAASLHERIVRRAQTTIGEFVHDPTYGTEWREKGLLRLDGLQRLQSRLMAQIKREPDVVRCEVALGQVADSPGVLSVRIKADTADGPLVVSTEVGRP